MNVNPNAGKPRRFPFLATLFVLPFLAFRAPAGPPEGLVSEEAPIAVDPMAAEAPAKPAVSDCALSTSTDPNGASRRRAVADLTDLLAASHPFQSPPPPEVASRGEPAAAQGSPAVVPIPVGGEGMSGVRTRFDVPVAVNYIDEEIFGAMSRAGIKAAPRSSDAEFLRRATLDLTGRIPDAATVQAFLADTAADKRDRMIDQLLASDAFVDRWALFYGDLFRSTAFADSGALFPAGRNAFHAYFQDAIRSRKPYDVMVRELLSTSGITTAQAATNFTVRNLQNNGPPQDTYDNLAATTGSVLLGVNIFCTSCHSGAGHTDSINLWLSTVKRADFWGMSAFFARATVRRTGTTPADYYFTVGENNRGDYQLGTTTGNKSSRDVSLAGGASFVTPKYLFGGTPANGESYRSAIARLVTQDPQFARATANYLWKELFGVGIVEPANDFDLLRQDPASPPPAPWTIQPTHPNLIKRLGQDFAASGYDLRSLLKTMARSSAYQLSSSYAGTWSETSTPYFARHFVRRLRSEEVLDAISKATQVPASLRVSGYTNPIAWAGQLPDVLEPQGRVANATPANRNLRVFLDAFTRGDRDSEARSSQTSISQALTMMNDVTVTARIKASTAGSTVSKFTPSTSPTDIVNALYLNTLSRYPSPTELATAVALFTSPAPGQTRTQIAEDLQFALLNKIDFLFNY